MLTLTLLAALAAHAQADCQPKQLTKDVLEAAPVAAADLFVTLAECDPAAAAKVAPQVVPTFLSGESGNLGAVASIKVGAPQAVVTWISSLQSDERAGAISALGEACKDSPEVQNFFLDRSQRLGEDFWAERWYRALTDCRVPALQNVLWERLQKGLGDNRTLFFGVLEVYARSAGGEAVPRLKQLSLDIGDEEAQTYIVAAFADAARVGSLQGPDAKASQEAVAAVKEIAPKLQVKAVEQARITLATLGDERGSDELVAVRYASLKQPDGTLLWGTVVVENATCKNGKAKQRLTFAKVTDGGQTWPDQLKAKVEASVKNTWDLGLAQSCKGEGTIDVLVPAEPFADKGAWKKWVDEQMKLAEKEAVPNPAKVEQDPVAL